MKHGLRGSAVLCPLLLLTVAGGPAHGVTPADPDSLRLFFSNRSQCGPRAWPLASSARRSAEPPWSRRCGAWACSP
jgi:hypothetical protein